MRDLSQAGKWVQVRKGTYKGDVGHVLSTTDSEVVLLLIPRMAPPNLSPLKRKRIETFPTALFNHETVKQIYNIEPIRIHDNIYSFRNDRFEYGLIVKSYNTDSVSTAVSTMPLECFSRFRESCHPKLIAFPRPSEWCFAEGEEVYIVDHDHDHSEDEFESIESLFNPDPPSYKSAVISTIRDDSAELDTDGGILCVSWLKICKIIVVGDFVEVTGGMHKGQRGWVDEVTIRSQVANVIQLVDNEKPLPDRCEVSFITKRMTT